MFGFRLLRALAPLAVVCGALFAVSCGGSNSSPSTPTSYPTNAADVVTLTSSAGQIALPQVSPGASVTLNYIGSSASPFPSPFPSAGVSLSTTIYSTPPTNAPAPTSIKRAKLSLANAVGVQYVTFTVSTAMPTSFISSEVLNLTSTMPVNQPYFVELDDITTPTYINTYPGTAVNDGTVTFTNSNGFKPACNGFAVIPSGSSTCSTLLNSNDTYLMQVYYLTTGVPATPTPSPTPVASPSATLVPVPTPTPVAVATTIPMGAATTISNLPVVAGGFVASQIQIPAAGTSATSLTVSGSPALPSGIAINTTNSNSLYPLYVLGFTATSTVNPFTSPAFNLVLPSNFSSNTYPTYGALCTLAACPVDTAKDVNVSAKVSNGIVSFAAGAFPGMTGVSPTAQYIIVYSSRSTPAQNNASPVPIAAGGTGTVTLPPVTGYSGALTIGGLGGATTVNVATEPGLLPGVSAIVPNTQTIFYSLSINAAPHVSAATPLCGSSGCTLVSLTVPPALVTNAPSTAFFYVEECSATACPINTSDTLKLTTPAAPSYVLAVPGTFGADITSLDPSATTYLVFYYQ
jgi:hypothetical protein